jgi:hypothetical protein
MMTLTDNESLVMRFFHAWHAHDYETMRRCLAHDVRSDLGRAPMFDQADEFIEYIRKEPSFRDVTLLELLVQGARAALLFEGISMKSGIRSRAAVFFRLEWGKIRAISVAAIPLDDAPDSGPSTWRSTVPTVMVQGAH